MAGGRGGFYNGRAAGGSDNPTGAGGNGSSGAGGGQGGGGGGGGGSGITGGAGGNGGLAGGGNGAGGAGGPAGSVGQPGSAGVTTGNGTGGGGGGGGGGAHGYSGAGRPGGAVSGAPGGAGGVGGDSSFPSAGGQGGGGGAGGYGAVITGSGTLGSLNSTIGGGRGGDGGLPGQNSDEAGQGGSGGVGLYLTSGSPTSFTVNANVAGGNGGANQGGGAGGVGIVGGSLAITSTAAISGGRANGGAGDQAAAITFTGGDNTLTSNTGATYTGAINIASGATLTLNQTNAFGGTGGFTYSNAFTDAGALTVNTTAARPITLIGANTYTGTTTVTAGILNIQNATALGTTAAGTTVASGAAMQLQGGIAVGAEALELSGTGISNGGALDSVSGTNTFAGAITLGASARINVDTGTLLLTGGISGNAGGRTLTLGGTGNGEVSTASITAVTGGLVKDGTGTWTLSADNTYASGTTISAGTLQIGNGGTTGSITGDIANNAALIFNRSNNLSFGGVISGTGTLQKLGAGVLTLTNVDTYTGATTVSGGTLLVNGSISGSATTVQNGGTLGGSGTAGTVTVASGGILSPGNSPGLLNTGDLALANGATYVEEIGGTTGGTLYDQTNVRGTVNLNSGANAGGGATLSVSSFNGFTPSAGQSFVIINNDGNDAVVGTFAGLAEGATVTVNGVALTISYRGGDGNDVTLSAPVPFNPPSGPTAVNDIASAIFGRVLTATAPGVLANDSGSGGALTVSEVNGQTANVGKAVLGTYGSLTLKGDGSYTYTPDATKTVFTTSVVDHFTYTDTANGQTATANLDITVSAPPASTLALFGTVVTNSASQTGSVYALYEGLLGRAPDALGLEGFSASLQAGAKLTDVAAAILNSAERGGLVSDPNAYVQALYTNTLHRAPDSAGQQFYVNELNSGVSQATVAVQFASSTEAAQVNAPVFSTGVFVTDAIDAAVARLYYGLLGRTPDAMGLSSFEMQVKQAAAAGGVNGAIQGLASVANAMLGSQEYGATHTSQSNAAFVDSLFVGALGRHADAGGSAFYTNELAQGVSQAQVALQIAQSQEAQVHLVGQIELGWHII